MKSNLKLGIICCTVLTFLTPSTLNAQTSNYGTNRQPRTCASRLEPRTGPLSVAQAKKYVACDNEGPTFSVNHSGRNMKFIDILSLQVAPKSRPVTFRDIQDFTGIDAQKPAYDIRGSVVKYTCNPIDSNIGRNCMRERMPESDGMCYRKTFGDWHCYISGERIGGFQHDLPAPK
jgi:hypothetical protein